MTCSNATVTQRLKPRTTDKGFRPDDGQVIVAVGTAVTLSALNIRCSTGNGNVSVRVNPAGQTIILTDTGTGPDQFAGDGIYSATFVPPASGTYVLTFPDGDVSVAAIVARPYTVQPTTFAYRDIIGSSVGDLVSYSSSQSYTFRPFSPPFPVRFGGATFDATSSIWRRSPGRMRPWCLASR